MKLLISDRILQIILIIVLIVGFVYTNANISQLEKSVDKTQNAVLNDNSSNGITDVGNNLQSVSNKADEINSKVDDLQRTVRDLCLASNLGC